jgi:uncharacterized membrane protein
MVAELVHKTLNSRIAPKIYIMMFVSVFIGFCFATGLGVAGTESILYSTGVLVNKQAWGLILFSTATIAEIGLLTNNETLINIGGISGFMAWLFACIALTMAGHWYILVSVALFHLLFHGYVVLATSLGYIYRRPA